MIRLALHLGRLPREIEHMTSAELAEIMAFNMLEPIGQERIVDGFRLLASGSFTRDGKAIPTAEFLPVWRPQSEIKQEESAAKLRAWLDFHAVEEG